MSSLYVSTYLFMYLWNSMHLYWYEDLNIFTYLLYFPQPLQLIFILFFNNIFQHIYKNPRYCGWYRKLEGDHWRYCWASEQVLLGFHRSRVRLFGSIYAVKNMLFTTLGLLFNNLALRPCFASKFFVFLKTSFNSRVW